VLKVLRPGSSITGGSKPLYMTVRPSEQATR